MSRHKYDGWLQVAPGTYEHRVGKVRRLEDHRWTTKARGRLAWSERIYDTMWRAMAACVIEAEALRETA